MSSTTTATESPKTYLPPPARGRVVKAGSKARISVNPPSGEEIAIAAKLPPGVEPEPRKVMIVANANVGWGNAIYVRGEGGGLSWDEGVQMVNVMDDEWVWEFPEDDVPVKIKFLRNDTDWDVGGDHPVNGDKISVYHPEFR